MQQKLNAADPARSRVYQSVLSKLESRAQHTCTAANGELNDSVCGYCRSLPCTDRPRKVSAPIIYNMQHR